MSAGFPEVRARRLRGTKALRAMVAETALRPAELVLPVFIKEGIADPQPIGSMPGVVQHTRESLRKAAAEAAEAGVGGIIVFGVPADKDGLGSAADDPEGISQVAISDISRGRRRPRADGRPLPLRVHRPRALRHRYPRGNRGQRRDA